MNPRVALVALGYAGLVAYASLYPFTWRAEGVDALGFFTGQWAVVAPRTDNYANVLAYLPLGLLAALSFPGVRPFPIRVLVVALAGAAVSFCMEFLQQYVPGRIPSQADLATNASGALAGALLAGFSDEERFPGRMLSQWRARWVKPGRQYDVGLLILAAWALSQWLPGLPSLNLAHLRAELVPLWHAAQDLSSFDLAHWGRYTLYISGLALLVRTLGNPGRPAVAVFFLFVAGVLAYKVPVVYRQLSLEAVAGALSAVALSALWLGLRVRTVACIAALFIAGGLACAHFLPGPGSPEHLSNWAPFRGPIDHPTLGLGSVLEILWPPAALGYLSHLAASPASRRTVAWAGGVAFAAALVALDWHAKSIPLATVFLMAGTLILFGGGFARSPAQPARRPNILERNLPSAMTRTWVIVAAASLIVSAHIADALAAAGRTLRVGPQHALKTPSAAAKVARDGDLVEIQAGLYAGDAAVWRQNNLTLRGVGGLAHLRADGAHAEGKAIWVIKGANTTVEAIAFSDAKVPDRNGAGIRLEGAGLIIRNCYFHHNENGILTAQNLESDVLIEHSEFAHNGFGDGQSHNLYIGKVRSFTLRASYVHHAIVGHNVKSRAVKSYITYNRIMDEVDGRSSYAIDLPDGGLSFVIGNVIQQGPTNENRTIVAYGAEGFKNPLNELYFVHNTVVNDDPKGARFIFVRAGADAVRVINNLFSGPGDLMVGRAEMRYNARVTAMDFLAPANFDYRLKQGASAIGRGTDPGSAYGFSLRPVEEYADKAQKRLRPGSGPVDLGAFQYGAGR